MKPKKQPQPIITLSKNPNNKNSAKNSNIKPSNIE